MTTRTLVAACATLTALTTPSVAAAADAQTSALKFKQPTCGKFQKQVQKTTGDRRRSAKRNLEQCKADMGVYKQVRNQRFAGTRADGVEVDILYCANGKWQDEVADGGEVGTSGWRVVDAKVRGGGTRFSAVIEAWIPGGVRVQGLVRNGDDWQVGYESGGEVRSPGAAEKTDARATCAAL